MRGMVGLPWVGSLRLVEMMSRWVEPHPLPMRRIARDKNKVIMELSIDTSQDRSDEGLVVIRRQKRNIFVSDYK